MSTNYKNANNIYDLYTFDKVYGVEETLNPESDGVFVGRFVSQGTVIYQKIIGSDNAYTYKQVGNLAPTAIVKIPSSTSVSAPSEIDSILSVTKDSSSGAVTVTSPLALLSAEDWNIYSSSRCFFVTSGESTKSNTRESETHEFSTTETIDGAASPDTKTYYKTWVRDLINSKSIFYRQIEYKATIKEIDKNLNSRLDSDLSALSYFIYTTTTTAPIDASTNIETLVSENLKNSTKLILICKNGETVIGYITIKRPTTDSSYVNIFNIILSENLSTATDDETNRAVSEEDMVRGICKRASEWDDNWTYIAIYKNKIYELSSIETDDDGQIIAYFYNSYDLTYLTLTMKDSSAIYGTWIENPIQKKISMVVEDKSEDVASEYKILMSPITSSTIEVIDYNTGINYSASAKTLTTPSLESTGTITSSSTVTGTRFDTKTTNSDGTTTNEGLFNLTNKNIHLIESTTDIKTDTLDRTISAGDMVFLKVDLSS